MISLSNIRDLKIIKNNHVNNILTYINASKTYRKYLFDTNIYLDKKHLTLRDILNLTPNNLHRIAENQKNNDKLQFLETLYTKNFSRKGSSLKGYNSIDLALSLDISVCPYCNKNYINTISNSKKSERYRFCQFDHFYPKSKYKYLSLSFYNLIPSCSTCNKLKGTKIFKTNPYETRDTDVDFRIRYKDEVLTRRQLGLYKPIDIMDNIQIDITSNQTQAHFNSLTDQISRLRLNEVYECHQEIANEILIKIILLRKGFISDIPDYLEELISVEDCRNLFLNNYEETTDFHKKPFSKMTNSICKQFLKD